MNWTKRGPQWIESECGRFVINRAGEPPVYQAVDVSKNPSVILLGRGTLTECKQACKQACEEAA